MRQKRLLLSVGDEEGIGATVIEKALARIGPQKGFQFLVWTEGKTEDGGLSGRQIPNFKISKFFSSREALNSSFREDQILEIKRHREQGREQEQGPGKHLEEMATVCRKKQASAMITGPVEKNSLQKTHPGALGQTQVLKKLCHKKELFMCFRGKNFNVVLLNDHCPLKEIGLDHKKLKACLELALSARSVLPSFKRDKPLGLLGLNPHAGEGGLLGQEEELILKPMIKNFKEVEGPLSPDSAFLQKNWKKYSFFVCLYHDQGLIPFKMAHGYSGFTQTLGLDFLRFGLTHGTARGLKREEVSDQSLFAAIREAIRLA